MDNTKDSSVTLDDLARMMHDGFERIDERFEHVDSRLERLGQEVQLAKYELRREMHAILPEEEKEELFMMVRHYNDLLDKSTLGKQYITLTRAEYDEIQKLAGFDHRFQQ